MEYHVHEGWTWSAQIELGEQVVFDGQSANGPCGKFCPGCGQTAEKWVQKPVETRGYMGRVHGNGAGWEIPTRTCTREYP
jgi:hypothetical protein